MDTLKVAWDRPLKEYMLVISKQRGTAVEVYGGVKFESSSSSDDNFAEAYPAAAPARAAKAASAASATDAAAASAASATDAAAARAAPATDAAASSSKWLGDMEKRLLALVADDAAPVEEPDTEQTGCEVQSLQMGIC